MGVAKIKTEWAFVLFAGVLIKPNFWKKYTVFMEDDKDVLFRIDAEHLNFETASLNGMMLPKDVIKNVGPLPEIADLVESRIVWGCRAMEAGYRLKGLLGVWMQ
jgi:hypothetical protein